VIPISKLLIQAVENQRLRHVGLKIVNRQRPTDQSYHGSVHQRQLLHELRQLTPTVLSSLCYDLAFVWHEEHLIDVLSVPAASIALFWIATPELNRVNDSGTDISDVANNRSLQHVTLDQDEPFQSDGHDAALHYARYVISHLPYVQTLTFNSAKLANDSAQLIEHTLALREQRGLSTCVLRIGYPWEVRTAIRPATS